MQTVATPYNMVLHVGNSSAIAAVSMVMPVMSFTVSCMQRTVHMNLVHVTPSLHARLGVSHWIKQMNIRLGLLSAQCCDTQRG